jgi:hypothetical protein
MLWPTDFFLCKVPEKKNGHYCYRVTVTLHVTTGDSPLPQSLPGGGWCSDQSTGEPSYQWVWPGWPTRQEGPLPGPPPPHAGMTERQSWVKEKSESQFAPPAVQPVQRPPSKVPPAGSVLSAKDEQAQEYFSTFLYIFSWVRFMGGVLYGRLIPHEATVAAPGTCKSISECYVLKSVGYFTSSNWEMTLLADNMQTYNYHVRLSLFYYCRHGLTSGAISNIQPWPHELYRVGPRSLVYNPNSV